MKRLAILGIVAAFAAFSLPPAVAQEVTAITGAGSTFAHPILSKWSREYRFAQTGSGSFPTVNSGLEDPPSGSMLDYEPSGSLAGTMRARDGAVDFGASDVPLHPAELAKLGLVQFPIVMGGVVAVVNIDGVRPGTMKLTGALLADIYMGRIQNWADPAIKAINPDIALPDARIAVIHRAEGSGTTFNWADYLARMNPQWRETVGVDTVLNWPTGTGVKGNDGVARTVKQTRNAIGYVEYGYAVRAGLSFTQIRNRAGRFVTPSLQSFQAAAASADWAGTGDFHLMLTDAPGDDAYPIAATVFAVMQKQPGWLRRPKETLDFFRWSLDEGGRYAAELGYVPLPAPLVTRIKGYWAKNFRTGT